MSPKWEQNALSSPHQIIPDFSYVFPEEDLLATLVQHYFEDANWILPVLHRPTFEAALANNMHLTDDGFARVVLLVCAVGSAYLDDRRVLTDPSSGHWHTAGVRWFEQVVFSGHTAITHPSLYDLQAYCVRRILTLCIYRLTEACSAASQYILAHLTGTACPLDAHEHGNPVGAGDRYTPSQGVQRPTECV
jgi:hypothetical protein